MIVDKMRPPRQYIRFVQMPSENRSCPWCVFLCLPHVQDLLVSKCPLSDDQRFQRSFPFPEIATGLTWANHSRTELNLIGLSRLHLWNISPTASRNIFEDHFQISNSPFTHFNDADANNIVGSRGASLQRPHPFSRLCQMSCPFPNSPA